MSGLGVMAVVVLLFAIGVGGFFFIKSYRAKIAKQVDDDSTNPDLQTATDMLPFKKIWSLSPVLGITDLGDGDYRAYIRVGSINYNLESNTGQNVIEANYRYLINSFPYPWIWHTETHNIDYRVRRQLLDEDVTKTLNSFRGTPAWSRIREYYYQYKQNELTKTEQGLVNGTAKKEIRKYVIIPFNSSELDPGLDEDQLFAESMQQITERVDEFMSSLYEMKLPSDYLSRAEIIQLYTSEYNRDNNLFSDGIADGTFTTVYADVDKSKWYLDDLHDSDKLRLVLDRAENGLETSILRLDSVDPNVEKVAKDVSNYLNDKLNEVQDMQKPR